MTSTLRHTEKCCAPDNSGTTATPLLVFADDWGRHPSSCQHLIRRLLRDHRILWVNSIGTRKVKANSLTVRRAVEKFSNWGKGLTQTSTNMWVVDIPMLPSMGWEWIRNVNRKVVVSHLKRILSRVGISRPSVFTTLPYMNWLIQDLPRESLTYYCTDDYSFWPEADRETMQQADHEISLRADRILAASEALHRQHEFTGRCCYFPHGVDVAHFAKAQQTQLVAPELDQLKGPKIGFFGLIYEKLDFGLLTALAQKLPHANLVMIGPIAWRPSEFHFLPNIHFIGPKPYEELPRYIAGLDVLLLPYVDDPMIRASGPLKLRECLAAGKPTVSIDVPDVRAYQSHVRIGRTQEEFIQEVRLALQEPSNDGRIRARQEAVANDSWDQRALLLRRHLAAKPTSMPPDNLYVTTATRRVLHLRTITGKGGGPEKTLLNSPRFLKDYDVRLAYIRPADDPAYDMPERARRLGVALVDIPEVGPADPRTLWRLIQEIRIYRPHILHAHDYKTDILAVLLGQMFKLPVVTTMHGYVTRGGKLEVFYRMDRWALRRMDHVIAVSADLYKSLENLGLPIYKRSLIDNAIDAEEFKRFRSVQEAKERLGLRASGFVVGAVGRLSPEKGFDVLLQALARLVKDGFDIELLLVGEGAEKSRLEALSRALGIADRVHLTGYQADTRPFYEAMDVFALSSLREGLPNVLLEAMALEVPVVATRIAGVPRLIADGDNGILVEPGSADALAQAMTRLLSDPGLRERLRRQARQTVEKRYSFAARIAKIAMIYDDLLAAGRRLAI